LRRTPPDQTGGREPCEPPDYSARTQHAGAKPLGAKRRTIMAFCKLPPGQAAALMFIEAVMASPNVPQKLKDLVNSRDWHTIEVAVSMGTPTTSATPTEADFAAVGIMSPGLQNANFVLMMMDAKATPDAKANAQKALDTHCWDWVAYTLVAAMKQTGLTFSGADLHQAYAPGDNAPCQMPPQPEQVELALVQTIQAGKLVGNFFSKSLPDFFEHDFANFFTGTVADFFKGNFANFFQDIGSQIEDGFKDFGNKVENVGETIINSLNPSNW
jgi:hypothetical protein